jgi:hypothetical protein
MKGNVPSLVNWVVLFFRSACCAVNFAFMDRLGFSLSCLDILASRASRRLRNLLDLLILAMVLCCPGESIPGIVGGIPTGSMLYVGARKLISAVLVSNVSVPGSNIRYVA